VYPCVVYTLHCRSLPKPKDGNATHPPTPYDCSMRIQLHLASHQYAVYLLPQSHRWGPEDKLRPSVNCAQLVC